MNVVITAWSGVYGDGLAEFNARKELPERKHLKLMERSVRLGVAAVGRALAAHGSWQGGAADRRGLFVGARPVASEPGDLEHAFRKSSVGGTLDVAAFGELGVPLVHPLWLVKGLSNNIPGYASAYWDLQGATGNRCEGRAGGLAAIVEAAWAVHEGRVDLAIAGGADSLLHAPPWHIEPTGEGAGFVVLERSGDGPRIVGGGVRAHRGGEAPVLDLGAAAGPVALCEALDNGVMDGIIDVVDVRAGVRAWVELG